MAEETMDSIGRRDLLKGALGGLGLGAALTARAGGGRIDPLAEAAADGIVAAWNRWLGRATYTDGRIQGVILSGGYLESDVDVAADVRAGLDALVPDLAEAFAAEAAEAWDAWYADWSLPATRAFPTFGAIAAPEAPLTQAQVVKLQPRASRGFPRLLSPAFSKGLCGKLACNNAGGVDAIVHDIVWIVGRRVQGWSPQAMVDGILGSGPVPSFAPPFIPVAPVVGKTRPGPVAVTRIP